MNFDEIVEREEGRPAPRYMYTEAYVTKLKDRMDVIKIQRIELMKDNAQLKAQNAKLRETLICRDGGVHDDDCKIYRDRGCNCGHGEVIRVLGKLPVVTEKLRQQSTISEQGGNDER